MSIYGCIHTYVCVFMSTYVYYAQENTWYILDAIKMSSVDDHCVIVSEAKLFISHLPYSHNYPLVRMLGGPLVNYFPHLAD
jgi:hypothetical protein